MNRKPLLSHLGVTLIVFDVVLSVIFLVIGYSTGNAYLRGVGVGLIIASVTSAIAHVVRKKTLRR
jgi:hypothetical protein